MLYIPDIGDYTKILTDNQVKDFLVINFGTLNPQDKICILN